MKPIISIFCTIKLHSSDAKVYITGSVRKNAHVKIVTGGGGQFNIRHEDAHVSIQGDFLRVEESESRSKLVLASGNANVDIRVDDGRVRLVGR